MSGALICRLLCTPPNVRLSTLPSHPRLLGWVPASYGERGGVQHRIDKRGDGTQEVFEAVRQVVRVRLPSAPVRPLRLSRVWHPLESREQRFEHDTTATARTGAAEIATAQEKIAGAVAQLAKIDTIKTAANAIQKNATKIDSESTAIRTGIQRLLDQALSALAGANAASEPGESGGIEVGVA